MPAFMRCDKCDGRGYVPKPNKQGQLMVCQKCSKVRAKYPMLPEGWILNNDQTKKH